MRPIDTDAATLSEVPSSSAKPLTDTDAATLADAGVIAKGAATLVISIPGSP